MEPLPDNLRCKRTDGRQWRCNRRVMDDKKLCEIHHLQGRHRQYRRKVPETLKLQRKKSKKSSASSSNFESLSRVSLKEGGSDSEEEGEGEELMRDLPNGFMAISPARILGMAMWFLVLVHMLTLRLEGVLPNKRDAVRLRKGKRKCHWCRSGSRTLIRCLSCRKEFYCLCCIKEQYLETQEDVRMKCPVCRRTCSCKACSAIQCRDIECKDLSKERSKVDKVLHFHYLICMLLPILKQINQDQSIEIEIEAKIKGLKPTEVEIQQAEISCNKQCCCNNCKASIVDFHRTCPDCSYSLCLSCCQDIFHGSLHGSVKGLLCKCPNGRKACISGKQLSEMKSLCATKLSYGSRFLGSKFSPCQSAAHCNGSIPCPPREFGGCGGSLLDLSCIFPLSWTKKLEVSAEELVGCYELPETLDVCSSCSLCVGLDCETNGLSSCKKQLQEKILKHWGRGSTCSCS
ncbi:lysine-specific demethylase JMJ28 [Populus alba]|uniref:lysine-specific demethylase JMJ28 n=1 Tax=Populus alba TaxID=43335 RepID=UPI003CC75D75